MSFATSLKVRLVLISVLLGLIGAGCGSSECSPSFVDEYNEVVFDANDLVTDLDVLTSNINSGVSATTISTNQEDVRTSALELIAQAKEFKNQYAGEVCVALIGGREQTVDADAKMDEFIRVANLALDSTELDAGRIDAGLIRPLDTPVAK